MSCLNVHGEKVRRTEGLSLRRGKVVNNNKMIPALVSAKTWKVIKIRRKIYNGVHGAMRSSLYRPPTKSEAKSKVNGLPLTCTTQAFPLLTGTDSSINVIWLKLLSLNGVAYGVKYSVPYPAASDRTAVCGEPSEAIVHAITLKRGIDDCARRPTDILAVKIDDPAMGLTWIRPCPSRSTGATPTGDLRRAIRHWIWMGWLRWKL